jgi:DNA-binding transcriptional LysR family regulator
MLNLSRLQLLHELSVLGTITAVAQAMNLTRPAVSQQLALLEAETGVVLFERTVRGALLTSEGRRLVARVAALFELVNDIEAELAITNRKVSGNVRIAAFGSVATTIVPDATAHLLKQHPSVEVQFSEMEPSDGLKAAAAKQVDIAIVDDLTDARIFSSSLEFHPLCTDHLNVVVSTDHRLAGSGKPALEINDLAQEQWTLNNAASSYTNFLINSCHAAGFEPRVACSCMNIAATLEFVRTAHFVTVLPSLALRPILDDPDFRIIPLEPVLNRRIFAALPKGSAKRPTVAATIAALGKASLTIVGGADHGRVGR